MLKPHREADTQWSWRTSRLVTIPKRVLCPKEFLGLSESLPNCSWVESFIVNRWQIINKELSWDLWTVLDNWENYGNSWLHTQSREIMDFYTCFESKPSQCVGTGASAGQCLHRTDCRTHSWHWEGWRPEWYEKKPTQKCLGVRTAPWLVVLLQPPNLVKVIMEIWYRTALLWNRYFH